MPRPIVAFVHPTAVEHNLTIVRGRASLSRVWAVVKANAYGHGIARILSALASADGIALLDLDEAVTVREMGWTKPILLLEGIFDASDLKVADEHDLTIAVHCSEQFDLIETAMLRRPIDINLKMNSGMNRLGFPSDRFCDAWVRARSIESVGKISLMSHFANADEGFVDWQIDRFDMATRTLPGERTLSNSAAVLWHSKAHRDWVRPGIILYGGSPSGKFEDVVGCGLRPAMTLRSEIIGIQSINAGDTVGYARAYTSERPMRIGVVACGYADGYPRHASTGTPIVVDGVRTQVVGRVSMDMLTVDLTPCPFAGIGSKVELWGRQVAIDDVAASSGTIGYELMCSLAKRVPVRIGN
jgi:alanine racemase